VSAHANQRAYERAVKNGNYDLAAQVAEALARLQAEPSTAG
jgi:hypothetical protein